jgi:hypothetical protein
VRAAWGRSAPALLRRRKLGEGFAKGRHLLLECLEERRLLSLTPIISEVEAGNKSGIVDVLGNTADWLELYNPDPTSAVNLTGWSLYYSKTGSNNNSTWNFPSNVVLGPGEFRVVFCDSNYTAAELSAEDAVGELDTGFNLNKAGATVRLCNGINGTGANVSSLTYPALNPDTSYGPSETVTPETDLVAAGAPATYYAPTGNTGTTWTQAGFNDSPSAGWSSGLTGLGFENSVNGFAVTVYKANITVGSVATATTVINTLADQTSVKTETAPYINYTNTPSVSGYFSTSITTAGQKIADRPYPGMSIGTEVDNYVMQGTGTITIPSGEGGNWTFYATSNAGFSATINGTNFKSDGAANTLDTINLAAGTYPVTFMQFQASGNSYAEFSAAQGSKSSFDSTFRLVGDQADGGLAVASVPFIGSGSHSGPFAAALATNVKPAVTAAINASGNTSHETSLYTRIAFSVSTLPSTLTLKMQYDDGYVAYLNGVPIASANAPSSPQWNSLATEEQSSDIQATSYEDVNVSSFIGDLTTTGTNVLAIQVLMSSNSDGDMLVVPELATQIPNLIGSDHVFATPTPRAANAPGDAQPDVAFTDSNGNQLTHGFYYAPIQVTLTADIPGASIYYTTDNSVPSASNGMLYNPNAPVSITTTTDLQAVMVAGGITSPVQCETYVFPVAVASQPAAPAGFPPAWDGTINNENVAADYAMSSVPGYTTQQVISALTSLPTMSLVTTNANLFGPSGIYANSNNHNLEVPGSFEYFNPLAGTTDYGALVGLQMYGGVGRNAPYLKHSMAVCFDQADGPSSMKENIYGDGYFPDRLILRSGFNDSFAYYGTNAQYIIDQWTRDALTALGTQNTPGIWVQLFVNGLYWGIYDACAHIDNNYAANFFGGVPSDYTVYHSGSSFDSVATTAGWTTMEAWNDLFNVGRYGNIAGTGVASSTVLANPAAYALMAQYLNLPSFCDYIIVNYYGGNWDWDWHNWSGIFAPPNPSEGFAGTPFIFQDWDGEGNLEGAGDNITARDTTGEQTELFVQLLANPDFRQMFADHVYKDLSTVLSPAGASALYQKEANTISQAIIDESARWGNIQGTQCTPANWNAEISWHIGTYFPGRTATMFSQFETTITFSGHYEGGSPTYTMYPSFSPPMLLVNGTQENGGTISLGDSLTMTMAAPAGAVIYYTTDGSDPRLPGGAANSADPGFSQYSGAITFTKGEEIKARVLSGSTWSALNDSTFYVNLAPFIRITELMYDPLPATAAEITAGYNSSVEVDGQEDFEFVELLNIEPQNQGLPAIPLQGLAFTNGVAFTFPNVSLAAGQYVVVVSNEKAFEIRYPNVPSNQIAGQYTGHFNNGGEEVTLTSPGGGVVQDFSYDPTWYPQTAGGGFSLVVGNANQALSLWGSSSGWNSSSVPNGTPGYADPLTLPLPGSVVVNEVLSNPSATPGGDTIEFYNTTSQPITIGQWFVSNNSADLTEYQIAPGTVIGGYGYYVLTQQYNFDASPSVDPGCVVPFALNPDGDNVYLSNSYGAPLGGYGGQAGGYQEQQTIPAMPAGYSYGLYTKSDGATNFTLLRTPTFGTFNNITHSYPGVGNDVPYVSPLVTDEIMYNPTAATAAESALGYADNDFEYVELYNRSGAPVSLGNYYVSGGIGYTPGWLPDGSLASDFTNSEFQTLESGATATWQTSSSLALASYTVYAHLNLYDGENNLRNLDSMAQYTVTCNGTQTTVLVDQNQVVLATLSVTSLTYATGLVTGKTAAGSELSAGGIVHISGATQSQYDGTFVVQSATTSGNTTTFTYQPLTAPSVYTASGTFTAGLNDVWINLGTYTTSGTVSVQLARATGAKPSQWTVAGSVKLVAAGGQTTMLGTPTFNSYSIQHPTPTLAPGAYAVLASNAAAFDERNPGAANSVVGVFSGHLNNGGDTVDIYQIGSRNDGSVVALNGYVPAYRVDHVNYNNASPWPTQPDGDGPALIRIHTADYGNDSANWQTSNVGGTPGTANVPLDQLTPPVPTGLAGHGQLSPTAEISLTWNASSDPRNDVGGYDIYRNGSFIGAATTTSYVDNAIGYGTNYTYTVATVNRDGYQSARSAGYIVALPSVIGYSQPASTQIVICFSEPLVASTKTNYTVSGMNVYSVSQARNGTEVILTLTSAMTIGTAYTVTMNNLTTVSGDPLPATQQIAFTYLNPGTGSISWKYFGNIGSSTAVSALTAASSYPYNPTHTGSETSFEAPANNGPGGGEELYGYLCPPITGYYIFTIASDDNGQLWLSTNKSPANLAEIAYVTSSTGYRDWNNVNNYEQMSSSIYLTAGLQYYVMALEKCGSDSSDNLSVRWEIPATIGGAASTWENGNSAIPIPGSRLEPAGIVPDNMTPPAPADLSATMNGSNSQVALTWNPVLGLPSGVEYYNVYRDGTLYSTPGAVTSTSFTDMNISPQTRHSYQVTAVNFDGTEGVKSATVTAVPVGIASITTPTTTSVQVQFTEPVDPATAQNAANYSITSSNCTISAAVLKGDGYTVTLTTSYLGGSSHTLTVTGVMNQGLSAQLNSTGTFTYSSGSSYVPPPFSVGVNPEYTNDSSPALTGTINDPAASVTVRVRVNGVYCYYAATNNLNGTWSVPRGDISALGAGSYDVVVTGVNTSGIVAFDSATVSELNVSMTSPTVSSMAATTFIPPPPAQPTWTNISASPPPPLSSPVNSIAIQFSEPVYGFGLQDLQLTLNGVSTPLGGASITSTDNQNWTLANLSGLTAAQGIYALSVTAAGWGTTDHYGNPLMANTTATWVMGSAPMAILTAAPPTINFNNASGNSTNLTVTYTDIGSAINNASLLASNLAVSNGSTVATVTLNPNLIVPVYTNGVLTAYAVTYTIAAPGGTWGASPQGTYTVSLLPSQVTDGNGNALTELNTGTSLAPVLVPLTSSSLATFLVDTVADTAGVTTPPPQYINATSGTPTATTLTVTYTDVGGTGINLGSLTASNLAVSNGSTVATVTVNPNLIVPVYTNGLVTSVAVTYTIAAPGGTWAASTQGTYTVSLVVNQVWDVAGGNAVAASPNLATFTVDTVAPTASATTPPPTYINSGNTTTLTVTYADIAGSGIKAASLASLSSTPNLTVSNGTAVATVTASVSGNVVTYTITAPQSTWAASAQGTYTVNLGAGQVQDNAGNYLVAAANFAHFMVDTNAPTVTVSSPPQPITAAGYSSSTEALTVTYTDSVSGINLASLSGSNLTVKCGTTTATVSIPSPIPSNDLVYTNGILTSVAVPYTVWAPGGTWGNTTTAPITPQGTYVVSLDGAGSQMVADNAANAMAYNSSLAQFTVHTLTPTAAPSTSQSSLYVNSTGAMYLNAGNASSYQMTFYATYTPSNGGGIITNSIKSQNVTVSGPMTATVNSVSGSAAHAGYLIAISSSSNWGSSGAQGTYTVTTAQTQTYSVQDTNGGYVTSNMTLATFMVDTVLPTTTLSTTQPSMYINSTSGAMYVNATSAGVNTTAVTVDYADNSGGSGIDPASLTTSNLTVSNGATVTGVSYVNNAGTYAVTYTITAPSGDSTWGAAAAQGTYTVGLAALAANRVKDMAGNAVAANSSLATFTVDTVAPTISIGTPSASYAAGGPVTYTVTYADANFNTSTLTAANVSLIPTGSAAAGTVSVSGSGLTYTVTVSGITGTGSLGISITSGTASDLAGNQAPAATSGTFTVDNTAPGISIGNPSASFATSGPVTYTVTYADANFNTSTLVATNVTLNPTGNASGTVSVSGSGLTYTVTISSITGTGSLGISITSGSASDLAGNLAPAAGPSGTFTVDNAAPSISIGDPSYWITAGGPIAYTVTYTNASSTALTADDVSLVPGGTAAAGTVSVTGSGPTYTVTVSGISGDGSLGISIAAGTATSPGGSLAPASGESGTFVVDNTPPTISVSAPSASYTTVGPVTYTVTYADAYFDTSNLATEVYLRPTGTANGTISISGSGLTYTVTLSNITGDGSLGIWIDNGTAVDWAGNLAPADTSGTFVVDNTAPTVSIGDPSASCTKGGPITYTVTYADTNFNTSTLTAADVSLVPGGTAAAGTISVSGSGTIYTVTVSSITGDGSLGISIDADTASDRAGNLAPASAASGTFIVDNTAPTISIGDPSASSASSGPITYTVTYADTNFNTSTLAWADVSLSKTGSANGTVSVDSGSGQTRTVTVSNITGNGTLGISIDAGTASDLAGNLAPASAASGTFAVSNFVAQPPVVTVGNAGAITFVRGGSAVVVAPNLTVSESSYADLLSATVTLSGLLDTGSESLTANTAGTSITAGYVAGVLTLSGSDTVAHYQQVLRSVTYVDTLKTTTNTGTPRTLSFAVSDASNSSTPVTGSVVFDVAPQVVGVYVSGSAWSSKLFNALAAAGVGNATLGFELPTGAGLGLGQGGQLGDLSIPGWTTLDTISIVFNEPVSGAALSSLALGDSGYKSAGLTVSGESNATMTVGAYTNTSVAKFTLSNVMTSNKYYIDLLAAGIYHTGDAGAQLDGEWATSSSSFAAGSGDGAPGGNFIFRFNVLAGDANGDGRVSAASDVNAVRDQPQGNDSSTNWRYDINGDGRVSAASDVNAVRDQPQGSINSFPEPTLPSLYGSATGSPAAPDATADGAAPDWAAVSAGGGATASAATPTAVPSDTTTVSSDATAVSSAMSTVSSDATAASSAAAATSNVTALVSSAASAATTSGTTTASSDTAAVSNDTTVVSSDASAATASDTTTASSTAAASSDTAAASNAASPATAGGTTTVSSATTAASSDTAMVSSDTAAAPLTANVAFTSLVSSAPAAAAVSTCGSVATPVAVSVSNSAVGLPVHRPTTTATRPMALPLPASHSVLRTAAPGRSAAAGAPLKSAAERLVGLSHAARIVGDLAWLGQAASRPDSSDRQHKKDLSVQALEAVFAQYGP